MKNLMALLINTLINSNMQLYVSSDNQAGEQNMPLTLKMGEYPIEQRGNLRHFVVGPGDDNYLGYMNSNIANETLDVTVTENYHEEGKSHLIMSNGVKITICHTLKDLPPEITAHETVSGAKYNRMLLEHAREATLKREF